VPVEFHVARDARLWYGVEEALFTGSGNVVLPDMAAARRLAMRMNDLGPLPASGRTGEIEGPTKRPAVHAGQLSAMGLVDEILHSLVDRFRETVNPTAIWDALRYLEARAGRDALDTTLAAFAERFPTAAALRAGTPAGTWLRDSTGGVANREIALEELLLLWLVNVNPAFTPFEELFDDGPLLTTAYDDVIAGLAAYFGTQPPLDATGLTLIETLRAPALAVPDSLGGQMRFIRERWGLVLTAFGDRLVLGLDVLAEEQAALAQRFGGPGGGPEDAERRASRAWLVEAGWYGPGAEGGDATGTGEPAPERFSPDLDWMPRLVLMAKSTYVWLDQLAKAYGRSIVRLDQVPDEELDRLARLGFSGLWLIGLWQRSRASETIKRLRGNPEAVASAYSLDDYRIADDLGGEAAFEDLKARAWARGIRMASDMVPNHMGIDSRWLIERPEWFVSLPESPYPAYSFTGPDLSPDPRLSIRIEDHYFDHTDAAVVFQRVDHATGDVRYVYHGNDGTSTPWNDTAQLDYLRADVREAVIETILAVARRSPVIRFDAAMTLAKRHIERLWYPEPGHAGGIPSRAEHALPRRAFEAAMPREFWRDVVDRVAAEVPDTLLLAEAFWLMEGYFVRTLGMHRVYNSAFMHMFRDEQNAQYRAVMRNTLEFDPEILKRYVNFMNNPDERTAVDQFGKGDKYFGVATLMATMPGLPMFGHGQIEGYAERYGMEYRRAYHDEHPDPWLVERHEREITPLLHRRALFAHVDEFLLYDFVDDDGAVNEDVFAYSNRHGGDRALVVYHNRHASASGRIQQSVAFAQRRGSDPSAEQPLVRRTLVDGLGLRVADGDFLILRDARTGLEYLRSTRELAQRGLLMELDAYECRVFLDVAEVSEGPGRPYGRLAAELGSGGVPSVEAAMQSILLRPVQEPLRNLLRPAALESWRSLAERDRPAKIASIGAGLSSDLAGAMADLLHAARGFVGREDVDPGAAALVDARLATAAARLDPADLVDDADLVAFVATEVLASLPTGLGGGSPDSVGQWVDAWGLGAVVADAFRGAGLNEGAAWRALDAVKALLHEPAADDLRAGAVLAAWLADEAALRALAVNEHRDVRWFGKEAFATLVRWWALREGAAGQPRATVAAAAADLLAAAADAGYRLDRLGTVGAAAITDMDPAAENALELGAEPLPEIAVPPNVPIRPT